jgi:hypothetical protein
MRALGSELLGQGMARRISSSGLGALTGRRGRLTALKVVKAKRPGMYADGGDLYLRVTKEGPRIGCTAAC